MILGNANGAFFWDTLYFHHLSDTIWFNCDEQAIKTYFKAP